MAGTRRKLRVYVGVISKSMPRYAPGRPWTVLYTQRN